MQSYESLLHDVITSTPGPCEFQGCHFETAVKDLHGGKHFTNYSPREMELSVAATRNLAASVLTVILFDPLKRNLQRHF